MRCIKCKKEIPDGSLFCNYCGKKQEQEPRKTLKRANGTGSVYKLAGRRKKPWVAISSKYVNGEIKRICLGTFATATEARAALPISPNAIPLHYDFTVKQVFEEWKASKYQKLGTSSQDGYNAAWLHLKPIENKKMRDIKTHHFQDIINELLDKGYSSSTMQKVKLLASKLCQHAMKQDIIDKNYGELIDTIHTAHKDKDKLSDEQIRILFDNDEDDSVKIILILAYTGLRINELFNITLDKVFIKDQYMVGGSKTNAGKNRPVPIHNKILPYVEHFYNIAKSINSKWLLCTSKGTKMNSANFRQRQFYPALERLGMVDMEDPNHLTPHCTRYTFVTLMIDKEVPKELIKKIAGHIDKEIEEKNIL